MAEDVATVITDNFVTVFAVKKDGTLWAWGRNDCGQLGIGNTIDQFSPIKVTDNISTVVANESSVFAMKKDNSLWAWGENFYGELGVGDTTDRHIPVKVA
ncbi:MAG: hypothetical protein UHU21_02955 [Lachnospiraceae bacterium]|nr:hypothetical protein [Lachnospiraceae bacterium]